MTHSIYELTDDRWEEPVRPSVSVAFSPGRFAVDAYVSFVREKPMLEAVASSLMEMFAPAIHEDRIAGLLKHYAFANDNALSYFRQRLKEAPREVE